MSGATAVAGTVQIVGGIALAPLLPGLVQHWKARLQGRRGLGAVNDHGRQKISEPILDSFHGHPYLGWR
jgi:hypothetical protein